MGGPHRTTESLVQSVFHGLVSVLVAELGCAPFVLLGLCGFSVFLIPSVVALFSFSLIFGPFVVLSFCVYVHT